MIAKAPSYKGYQSSSKRASKALAGNKATATKCERLLRSVLWRQGFRFRKNMACLPGKPDIAFLKAKVAVFCDGDFWHGKGWHKRRLNLSKGSNADYWIRKIESNIERDSQHAKKLQALGWQVIRIWESAIIADPESAAQSVISAIQNGPKQEQ